MDSGAPPGRSEYPAPVEEVLKAPIDKLSCHRPHKDLTVVELNKRFQQSLSTYSDISKGKLSIDPAKNLARVLSFAEEVRWRQVEGVQVELAQAGAAEHAVLTAGGGVQPASHTSGGRVAIPDPSSAVQQQQRFNPILQGRRSHGAKNLQLSQQQGARKQLNHLGDTQAAVRIGAAGVNQAAAAPNGTQPLVRSAQRPQGVDPAQPRKIGVLPTAPELKSDTAAARVAPRSVASGTFYTASRGGGGLNLQASIINAAELREDATQQQTGPSQATRARRGQQQQELQRQATGHKRSVSDAGDEDFQPRTQRQRAAVAPKQRGRRSAPVELEDKEPIDLADSSGDEGGAGVDAGQRANSGSAAGPGPLSAATMAPRHGAGGMSTRQSDRNFQSLSVRLAGLKCCYPPEGGKHSVEVAAEDLARLEKGEFLNDTCIDFYIKHIEHNLDKGIQPRYHFFNSFFLKKLQEKPPKGSGRPPPKAELSRQNHERVKKWTKHVDLFSKDYIFVPIHGYLHWSLVLICHPGNIVNEKEAYRAPGGGDGAAGPQPAGGGSPLMLHLDSLDGNHAPKAIFEVLRSYLEHEWARKATDESQDSVPRRWLKRFLDAGQEPPRVVFDQNSLHGLSMAARLPKQDNHTDCGLFLLSYMDFFVAANPRCMVLNGSVDSKSVHALDPRKESANVDTLLQKGWFKKCNAARLRDHLRALICGYMLEKGIPPEDERCGAAQGVVDSYKGRPCKMGERYLSPEEYLKYVTEKPDEVEPTLDDDVLSSGSAGEEPLEDPKEVLQGPVRRMTRAAARQEGVKPIEAIPSSPPVNKRRKVQGTASGAPAPVSQLAGDNKTVVDLSSPDKAADALHPGEEQEPADGTVGVTGADLARQALGDSAEPLQIDSGNHATDGVSDEDEVEVVHEPAAPHCQPGGEPPEEALGASATRGGRRVGMPPAKRPKLQARRKNAASQAACGEPAIHSGGAAAAEGAVIDGGPEQRDAAAVGPEAAATAAAPAHGDAGKGEVEDADDEPPMRPNRRRRRARSSCDVHVEHDNEPMPLGGDGSAAGDADAAVATESLDPPTQPSQQDPETLPGLRRAVASGKVEHGAVTAESGDASAQPDPTGGAHGYVPYKLADKCCRKNKALTDVAAGATGTGATHGEADAAGVAEVQVHGQVKASSSAAANACAPSLRGEAAAAGQRSRTNGAQAAKHSMEPPLDGLVPGDEGDADPDGDEDVMPLWVADQAEKLRAQADSEFGSPHSEDDFAPVPLHAGRNGGAGRKRLQKQCPESPVRGQLSRPVNAVVPAGHDTTAPWGYRTHTRFPDEENGVAETEQIPIHPDEASGAAAQPICDHGDGDGEALFDRQPVAAAGHRGAGGDADLELESSALASCFVAAGNDKMAAAPYRELGDSAAAAAAINCAHVSYAPASRQGHSSHQDGALASDMPASAGRPTYAARHYQQQQGQQPAAGAGASPLAGLPTTAAAGRVSKLVRMQLAKPDGGDAAVAAPRAAPLGAAAAAGAGASSSAAFPVAGTYSTLIGAALPVNPRPLGADEGDDDDADRLNLEYGSHHSKPPGDAGRIGLRQPSPTACGAHATGLERGQAIAPPEERSYGHCDHLVHHHHHGHDHHHHDHHDHRRHHSHHRTHQDHHRPSAVMGGFARVFGQTGHHMLQGGQAALPGASGGAGSEAVPGYGALPVAGEAVRRGPVAPQPGQCRTGTPAQQAGITPSQQARHDQRLRQVPSMTDQDKQGFPATALALAGSSPPGATLGGPRVEPNSARLAASAAGGALCGGSSALERPPPASGAAAGGVQGGPGGQRCCSVLKQQVNKVRKESSATTGRHVPGIPDRQAPLVSVRQPSAARETAPRPSPQSHRTGAMVALPDASVQPGVAGPGDSKQQGGRKRRRHSEQAPLEQCAGPCGADQAREPGPSQPQAPPHPLPGRGWAGASRERPATAFVSPNDHERFKNQSPEEQPALELVLLQDGNGMDEHRQQQGQVVEGGSLVTDDEAGPSLSGQGDGGAAGTAGRYAAMITCGPASGLSGVAASQHTPGHAAGRYLDQGGQLYKVVWDAAIGTAVGTAMGFAAAAAATTAPPGLLGMMVYEDEEDDEDCLRAEMEILNPLPADTPTGYVGGASGSGEAGASGWATTRATAIADGDAAAAAGAMDALAHMRLTDDRAAPGPCVWSQGAAAGVACHTGGGWGPSKSDTDKATVEAVCGVVRQGRETIAAAAATGAGPGRLPGMSPAAMPSSGPSAPYTILVPEDDSEDAQKLDNQLRDWGQGEMRRPSGTAGRGVTEQPLLGQALGHGGGVSQQGVGSQQAKPQDRVEENEEAEVIEDSEVEATSEDLVSPGSAKDDLGEGDDSKDFVGTVGHSEGPVLARSERGATKAPLPPRLRGNKSGQQQRRRGGKGAAAAGSDSGRKGARKGRNGRTSSSAKGLMPSHGGGVAGQPSAAREGAAAASGGAVAAGTRGGKQTSGVGGTPGGTLLDYFPGQLVQPQYPRSKAAAKTSLAGASADAQEAPCCDLTHEEDDT